MHKIKIYLLVLVVFGCGSPSVPKDDSDLFGVAENPVDEGYLGTAWVTAEPRLNVRSEPGGPVVCRVYENDLVKVFLTKEFGGRMWALIEGDECEGYAAVSYLEIKDRRNPYDHSFPFFGAADADYTTDPRRFGSCRGSGCSRLHAASDLWGGVGRPVYSVGKGTILDFTPFYLGTWAVVVDHGDFIVRYGEVDERLAAGLEVGSVVSRGQVIAKVGQLIGLEQSMLHFERYSGELTGPLTVRSNQPYQRRGDLVDPTEDLIKWLYPRF